jgi:hypothetical protein
MIKARHLFAIAIVSAAAPASANPISKDACVDAHSKGQDAREAGKLSLARKLFLTCAQPSCPSLVQSDCARFADDLNGQQPTVSFIARDAGGADLPDTTVYFDDELMVTRLDDGRPHDADPGKHTVRFSNGGRDVTVTIVLNAGEKGRQVIARFAGGTTSADTPISATGTVVTPTAPAAPKVYHPKWSKVLIGVGAGATLGGLAVGIVGMTRIPSNCSLSSHECVAAPGDPSLKSASSAVRLSDIGFGAAALGVAALTGGLVWYFTGSRTEHEESFAAMPWITPGGGGLVLSGHL